MSKFEDPVIISNSISGVIANRDQCPAIPYTPEEYAAEARRVGRRGRHRRSTSTPARRTAPRPGRSRTSPAITEAIRSEVGDVIINYSTGAIGVPMEKRIDYLRACRPDVAALNMSSMNYAKYSRRRKDFVFKAVFENSFDTIIEFITAMNELGIQPEHECFDAGHVANVDPLIDMGLLEQPSQISLVMGVTGGIRPTPRNVAGDGRPDPRRLRKVRAQLAGASASPGTSGSCSPPRSCSAATSGPGWRTTSTCPTARMCTLERRPDRARRGRWSRTPAARWRRSPKPATLLGLKAA